MINLTGLQHFPNTPGGNVSPEQAIFRMSHNSADGRAESNNFLQEENNCTAQAYCAEDCLSLCR